MAKQELALRSWRELQAREAARPPSVIRFSFCKTGDVLLDLGNAFSELGKKFDSPRLAIVGQLLIGMGEKAQKSEKS